MYSEPPKVIDDIKTKKFDEISKKIKKFQNKKPKKTKKEKQLEKIMAAKKKDIIDINTSIKNLNEALRDIQPMPDDLIKNIIS